MHHIDKYSSEYNLLKGKVVVNKNNPALWGIKLNLDEEIEIKDNSNNVKTINKDGIIPLVQDLKIKFNEKMIGEIKLWKIED